MSYPKRKPGRSFETLRAWREAQGFTLEQAAETLGYSLPGYHKIERGDRHPRGADIKRITAITGVPVEVLVGAL